MTAPTLKTLEQLRSRRWFADRGMRGFAHRQRMQQQGVRRQDVMDRPVLAIINTWSDLSPCHAHLRERAQSVKNGILQGGGFPVELPAMSLGEVMVNNVREPGVAKGNRSRGLLVSDYLLCGSAPLHYCRELEGGDYSGFNFLAADTTPLVYYSNRNGSPEVLPPGIYGVSNHSLDTPWPKLTAAKAAFTEALAALPIRDDCFALLADRAIAPDTRLPATGVSLEWERRLSAIFVFSPDYGTRTSSVAWITACGEALLEERNFFPDGSRGHTSLISTAE